MMLSDRDAAAVQALGDGMDHRRAHAAADAQRAAGGDQLGGMAQRAGDVRDGLARVRAPPVRGCSCRPPG